MESRRELKTLIFAESGPNLNFFPKVYSRQPLLTDTSVPLRRKTTWFPFLDLDTCVAKSSAFDDNNVNESFPSNSCQVMAFKNLSDYICTTHCLILEKTIPL